jgi:hypothetical protein
MEPPSVEGYSLHRPADTGKTDDEQPQEGVR